MSRDREREWEAMIRLRAILSPKIALGDVCMTPGAASSIPPREMVKALARHEAGDWGELCAEDRRVNDYAMENAGQIVSAYTSKEGIKFWIITEWDRFETTILLPDEF